MMASSHCLALVLFFFPPLIFDEDPSHSSSNWSEVGTTRSILIGQISIKTGKIADPDRYTGGPTNTSYRTRTNHNEQSLLHVPQM